MKKLIPIILVAAIIVAAIIIVPQIHTCIDCGETFFGTGYEPNIIEGFLSSDSEEEQIICEDCALEQHAVALFALGQTLEDFEKK